MAGQQRGTVMARDLRRNATDAERRLWAVLRRKQTGAEFRRQEPIGRYIVDFVCYEQRLIVEVDGGQHNQPEGVASDAERTAWVESQGFTVLRFWDNDVLTNLDGVYQRITLAPADGTRPHH